MPVNEAMSMGVHESQSLLWERMVGLSLPFQKYLLPKLQESFPDNFSTGISVHDLYLAQNIVKDISYIRTEADEVSYTMHIILRYEIERGLLNGDYTVDQVPALWNSKMLGNIIFLCLLVVVVNF